MDKIWKELFEYVAKNSTTESIFLSPCPTTTIEVFGLLDKIAELRGISNIENGKEFNAVIDSLKNENNI